jgi:hypothetical protein
MQKFDGKKQYSEFYSMNKDGIRLVEVPDFNYLMLDGQGDPNTSPAFKQSIDTLFSLAYTLKFSLKKSLSAIDYGVMPLEGIWWMDDMSQFSLETKKDWKWSLMIMQPEFISAEQVLESTLILSKRKRLPYLPNVRFEKYSEGLCAQILHTGPFSYELVSIEKLHRFIAENGYSLTGKHREIYMNDFRKTAPERLKTIIRQPIEKTKSI